MTLNEINTKILSIECSLKDLQNEHQYCVNASKKAFGFTDNWRDKQSIVIRIPIISKKINDLNKELDILKIQQSELKIVAQQQDLQEIQKAKENKLKEEELKFYIKSPISILEVE